MFCRIFLAALVVVAALVIGNWQEYTGGAYCSKPDYPSATSFNPNCYIRETYFESRQLFLHDLKRFGKGEYELESLEVDREKGLFIDVALFKGNKEKLILHISGTHGTEGYLGSGIQRMLLQDIDQTIFAADKSSRPTVVLVHALNPFGMSYRRRWNEDNVDLNRNAIIREEGWKEVLARKLNDFGYADIDHIVNSEEPPSLGQFITALIHLPRAHSTLSNKGLSIKQAMVAAQYKKPRGLFFGGTKLSKSHQLLSQHLKRVASPTAVKKFILIDIHSGLGPMGKDTVMLQLGDTTKAHKVFGSKEYGGDEYPPHLIEELKGQLGTGTASDGYEYTRGDTTSADAYYNLFPNVEKENSITLGQEFGTWPTIFVALPMVWENQAYHYSKNERQKAFFSKLVYHSFVPPFESKKTFALNRGVVLFKQAYHYLEKL